MSLRPIDHSEIPQDTFELGQKLLDENNMYRLIGDRLAQLISGADFVGLYSTTGGPAIAPVILSLVLIFQMLEKLPDRLAAEAVRLRIDWKYALHLPLEYTGFHFTNLNHFRLRLLEHGAESLVFDKLLQELMKLGFIRPHGRQRTDSTRIIGLVAKLSRLELVWETLRLALKAIEQQQPGWLEGVAPQAFLAQYWTKRSDYKLSEEEVARLLQQAGADGFWLLAQWPGDDKRFQGLAEVQTLQTIWEQQFELDQAGQYQGSRTKIKAEGLIQSPHEPEVRYHQKRGASWQGYTAHVTETAEDKGSVNFITDIGLAAESQLNDVEALPDIQARLEKRNQTPAEQYVDYAYVSGPQIARSEERGIKLIGPIAPDPGPIGFQISDFQIDVEKRQAMCPGQKEALTWSVNHAADGLITYVISFGRHCTACPFRPQCTTAKNGRRVSYQQYQPYITQRRQEMKTEAFWQAMKRRSPIEGTISQLVRQGMRRARYRGWARVNLQLILTATATNLRRLLVAWARKYIPSWIQPTA